MTIPRFKPLAKGLASFILPWMGTVHGYGNPLGTLSAESCYSIFLRQIVLLSRATGITRVPKIVAELGPGSSLGTGLAALIAGADHYYALDLIDFSDTQINLAIFDDLVVRFVNRAPIPSSGLQSLRYPDLDHYDFPDFLNIDTDAMFTSRMAAIRKDIMNKGGEFVQSSAPWTEATILQPHSLDWIFSQSVLEHVDDLDTAYHALAQWLAPGGYMSHLIDFNSHRLTQEWNGHWALGDLAWQALRGRRPYLLNRESYAGHQRRATANGFVPVLERRSKRFDGLIATQFALPFRKMNDEDARTEMAFAIHRSG